MHANVCKRIGSNQKHIFEHVHACVCTCSICTLNYFHPLMIVVIICGGKSHFHKVRRLFVPFPSTLLSSSALFPFLSSLPSMHISTLHSPPPISPSTSSPPCGRLIPLSYFFFCPKDIFPPTRPRLITLTLSIYLYQ